MCVLVAFLGFTESYAQVKVGDNPSTINADALLELESSGKGFLYPRVALTNTANAAPLSAHVQGMAVYNTATAGNVTPGLYVNNGTAWVPLTGTPAVAPGGTMVVACNGFTGDYTAGSGETFRTFVVTYTNNSFSTAQFTPSPAELVLSPGSGLTVEWVVPSTSQNISPGGTRVISYSITGMLTADQGTVITGTFSKFGLTCSKSVTVGN